MRLTQDRIRLYAYAQGIGLVSAVSDDGRVFTEEPGVRIAGTEAGQPPLRRLGTAKGSSGRFSRALRCGSTSIYPMGSPTGSCPNGLLTVGKNAFTRMRRTSSTDRKLRSTFRQGLSEASARTMSLCRGFLCRDLRLLGFSIRGLVVRPPEHETNPETCDLLGPPGSSVGQPVPWRAWKSMDRPDDQLAVLPEI